MKSAALQALPAGSQSLFRVELEDADEGILPDFVRRDRESALADLLEESHFRFLDGSAGPYGLTLSIAESRLVLKIADRVEGLRSTLVLSLKPYGRIVRDYFIIMNSHEQALIEGNFARMEAVDMGRRGLHNEGAALLIERLAGKIEMDLETARRLFTLICALHVEKVFRWS
ncbi:MAG TPA: UPF0262 family protein [Alphaproteobacteria bacterium]|nr:UPF0262 family protein [Alphaproteobacteria bacterium]